jgi:hypothetical protein
MTQPVPTILALASAPLADLGRNPVPALDIRRELDDLEQWLRASGRAVELHIEWAETGRLQRALLVRRFDLLHYSGHGSTGSLAFEDGCGGLQALGTRQLADLVCPGGQPAFRLAFLSACHSGSMAQALVDVGIPHVVAVDKKEALSDRAAAAFAPAFYTALLTGRSVAVAFAEGQKAVRTDPDLYRMGLDSLDPLLAEREALKFRLMPEPSPPSGGSVEAGPDVHDTPLFPKSLDPGAPTRYDPPASPHGLGPRPETFTGRQRELHELVNDVLHHRLTLLTGMGGMGKTELARQAGRWLAARGHFPGGIGWCDLHGVTDLAVIRARVAGAASLQAEVAASDETLSAALAAGGHGHLLILDDLDEAFRCTLLGLRGLLEAIYNAGGPHLLLTSRERPRRRPPVRIRRLGRLAPARPWRSFWTSPTSSGPVCTLSPLTWKRCSTSWTAGHWPWCWPPPSWPIIPLPNSCVGCRRSGSYSSPTPTCHPERAKNSIASMSRCLCPTPILPPATPTRRFSSRSWPFSLPGLTRIPSQPCWGTRRCPPSAI